MPKTIDPLNYDDAPVGEWLSPETLQGMIQEAVRPTLPKTNPTNESVTEASSPALEDTAQTDTPSPPKPSFISCVRRIFAKIKGDFRITDEEIKGNVDAAVVVEWNDSADHSEQPNSMSEMKGTIGLLAILRMLFGFDGRYGPKP